MHALFKQMLDNISFHLNNSKRTLEIMNKHDRLDTPYDYNDSISDDEIDFTTNDDNDLYKLYNYIIFLSSFLSMTITI